MEQFRCHDGTCIDYRKRCDENDDCLDGADEMDCICRANEFRCKNIYQCIDNKMRCKY